MSDTEKNSMGETIDSFIALMENLKQGDLTEVSYNRSANDNHFDGNGIRIRIHTFKFIEKLKD